MFKTEQIQTYMFLDEIKKIEIFIKYLIIPIFFLYVIDLPHNPLIIFYQSFEKVHFFGINGTVYWFSKICILN